VTRGVDDVDTVLVKLASHTLPETGSSRRSNGNTALLLLLHPVHGGSAIMHFTDFMVYASVKKDTFSCRCLTSVNVRTNTDITVAFNGSYTSHSDYLLLKFLLEF
jgi:hypothetical protein